MSEKCGPNCGGVPPEFEQPELPDLPHVRGFILRKKRKGGKR